ncbi:uncharacterized protein LOC129589457 isoform X2 [Paramacrobiotus metropolitanus]|uniref:uncharacterized protein LOC129589457 isoform X2 n=1 Tax=Paramacrobiotus metropolitanus TaxID=2943436 RepID=UPI00244615A1|nr:uncharacterized protein LOC129589457 isoform X2 [Paramacrobiotus metropolitanus]
MAGWSVTVYLVAIVSLRTGVRSLQCYSCFSEDNLPSLPFDPDHCNPYGSGEPIIRNCYTQTEVPMCISGMFYDPKIRQNRITRECADADRWTIDFFRFRKLFAVYKIPIGRAFCLPGPDPKRPNQDRLCFCTTDLCNKMNWNNLLDIVNYTLPMLGTLPTTSAISVNSTTTTESAAQNVIVDAMGVAALTVGVMFYARMM